MVQLGFTDHLGEESEQPILDVPPIVVNEKDKKPGVNCPGLK